jgi:DNA-binding NtrC family response regulator
MTSITPRILLVDDEPILLGALRREIERVCPGATVVYALNAHSAIWQLQNTSISMVITDLRMHGDENAGWGVVDAAQSLKVPVVVLTGCDVEASQRRCGDNVSVRPKEGIDRKKIAELIQPALH